VNFSSIDAGSSPEHSTLSLRLGDVEITLDAKRPTATIGRHAASDLILPDAGASRQHARLELRHGKFYLCDLSTNGTVLRTHDEKPTFLRREEAILVGSGRFGLSCLPETDPATPIFFEVKSGSDLTREAVSSLPRGESARRPRTAGGRPPPWR
jgi:adenylate cyclase